MSADPPSTINHVHPADKICCTQCNAIETAYFPKSEALNILHEAAKPGAHLFCSFEGVGESRVTLGYMLCQKTALSVTIVKIVVSPANRRRGIGRQLLTAVEDFAIMNNIRFCSLNVEESNCPALSLYLSHGYIKSDYRPDFYAVGRHSFHMEKELMS
jgi:ribosomal protein S18 acetylase RimI-like enzyme